MAHSLWKLELAWQSYGIFVLSFYNGECSMHCYVGFFCKSGQHFNYLLHYIIADVSTITCE